jgi:hypothetical protein
VGAELYKEVVKPRYFSSMEFLIGIVCSLVLLGILNFIGYIMKAQTSIVDVVTIITFGGIIYYVIRKNHIYYKYMLIGEEFIVQQIIGSRESVILNIHMTQIDKISSTDCPCFKKEQKDQYKAKMKFLSCSKAQKSYYGIYLEDGQKYFFMFQPSEKLLQLLNKKINYCANSTI